MGDPPVPISGTDSYQWLPGGFFLVHQVDMVIGQQRAHLVRGNAVGGSPR